MCLVYHVHAVPANARRGHYIPRTCSWDGCESLCECQESNLGSLKEQPVLLTAEPSLQPPCLAFEMGPCFVAQAGLEPVTLPLKLPSC